MDILGFTTASYDSSAASFAVEKTAQRAKKKKTKKSKDDEDDAADEGQVLS